jgi:toxin ParE1/3/4
MSLVYTRSARADLREIAQYFARVNQVYGRRLCDALREQCRKLEKSPGIGRLRDDLAEGLRSFVVGSYLIFYQESKKGIAVVRIIHGHRNITPEMFPN